MDFLALSEIWGENKIKTIRALATPGGYSFFHSCRDGKRGGGVGIICKNVYSPSVRQLNKYSTFEVLCVCLKTPPLNLVTVYRTGPCNNKFFDEFSELILSLDTLSVPYIILGDFNIHVTNGTAASKSLQSMLDIFSLQQHVNLPTHIHGNILDLIISNFKLQSLNITDPTRVISDHFLLNFSFSINVITRIKRPKKEISFRDIKAINLHDFNVDISNSLCHIDINLPLNDYLCNFSYILLECLNKHAPLINRVITYRYNCSFICTDELRSLKRVKRKCERNHTRAVSRELPNIAKYQQEAARATNKYFRRMHDIRENSSIKEVSDANGDSRALYNLCEKLTNNSNDINSNLSADDLSKFFSEKIQHIRDNIPQLTAPDILPRNSPIHLSKFHLTSEDEISKVINSSKKTKSPCEKFPSKLYTSITTSVLSYLLHIFNLSICSGIFPSIFKHAAVIPILKKPSLDANIPSSFRPISLLPFFSKILEKIIAKRIREQIMLCDADEVLQSGYKSLHSTETALLKVSNDLRRAADKNNVSIVLNLDLSAAFETLDSGVLLDRLTKFLGISGDALNWFKSYLTDRSQTVYFNNENSKTVFIKYGVPQGSVLGPLLFLIYILPLGILLRSLGFSFHFYADDTQIYISVTHETFGDKVVALQEGYVIINNFLSANFLKLNHDKSELILVGKPHIVAQIKRSVQSITLENTTITFAKTVKNLGVTFDESLSFRQHINEISKISLYKLRNLRHIRNHFNKKSFETLIHAFVTSKLDYCNSLFTGIPKSVLRPLQIVQNYAARLILKRGKFEHSTPLLYELHWLPILRRIDYKTLLITYKARNSLAPKYISELLSPANNMNCLRSADDDTLLQIDFSTSVTMGDRAFSIYASKIWNTVPKSLRETPSLNTFKSKLKTYLFDLEYFN